MSSTRYHILEKIGAGGMGAVFRAFDRLTAQTVALKRVTIVPQQLSFATKTPDTLDTRLALAQEFRTLATLRHPNIISVLDYGFEQVSIDSDEASAQNHVSVGVSHASPVQNASLQASPQTETIPFFTMELLEQPRDLLQAGKNAPVEEKIRLLTQVLQALAYLHRRGILHRDLKPENVLVNREGVVKVLDFGLAVETRTMTTAQVAGTLAYIAPEVLLSQQVTSAADLYSVGMIAYELFAGQYPYLYTSPTELIHALLTELPDLSLLDVDARLSSIIGRLLAKNPQDRYGSVGDVLSELANIVPLSFETAATRESFLQAARFVGREREIETLTHALEMAMSGRGSAWLIGGESGVGKSRLLDELRVLALVRDALVLRGQGVSEGGLTYQLWRDLARRLVVYFILSDTEASVLKMLVPDIAQLLERDIPDAPQLEGPAEHQRLISTLLGVLRRVQQPLVLLLEDLHWLRESLDVLKALIPLLKGLPILVIGTYRDDENPTLPLELPGMGVLRLGRLTRDDTAQLAESMLGRESDELTEFLQSHTEGNAFFLVEVVRVLAEDAGSLANIGTKTLPAQVFAGGIQRIVQRRLARVSPSAYRLLQIAATVGREIEPKVIETVIANVGIEKTDIPKNLDSWLTECADAAVLEIDDSGTWRFAHDKLREGMLHELSPDVTKALHRTAGEALEMAFPDAPEYTQRLVRHWSIAEDYAKEAFYALRAGEQALALSAAQDALGYFRRALAQANDELTRARLNVHIGQAYLLLGDYAQSMDYLKDGLEAARALDNQKLVADSRSWIGQILVNQGDYPPAQAHYEASLVIARALDYRPRIAEVLSRLGRIALYHSRYEEAIAYLEAGLALAKELGDLGAIAQAYNNLGIVGNIRGDYARAAAMHRESLSVARTLGDRFAIARSLNNLGEVHKHRHDYTQAQKLYGEALPILREINHKWGVAAVLDNMGYLAVLLNQPDEARRHFQEALRIGGEIGASTTTTDVLIGIARLAALEGELQHAAELIGLVRIQSGYNSEIEKKIASTLEQIQLSPQELETAFARGRQLNLQTVINRFLEQT